MRRYFQSAGMAATLLLFAANSACAATAELMGVAGEKLGTVLVTETPNGLLFSANFRGLPSGTHGFHIHETGSCAPDFAAAGGHLAGGTDNHGFMIGDGPHAGDMPNIHVPRTGSLTLEVFNARVTYDKGPGALFDDDGSALIVHANPDDYKSQPSGDAGNRIACGVIER
jgi:Cu-Zn family superoxide dismutase